MLFLQQQLFTRPEVEAIQEMLANRVCYRCKFRYCEHQDADHYFFEEPEDAIPEESN